MDCGHLEELSLWFDGEMNPGAKVRFERHMKGCATCRRARGELLALRDALQPDGAGEDPAGQRRVLERILAPGRPPIWRRPVPVPAPALAAMILALVALAGLALREASTVAPEPPGKVDGRSSRMEASRETAPGLPAPPPSRGEEGPPARPQGPGDAIDLARFDHGGRAVLYKIPRPPGGEISR